MANLPEMPAFDCPKHPSMKPGESRVVTLNFRMPTCFVCEREELEALRASRARGDRIEAAARKLVSALGFIPYATWADEHEDTMADDVIGAERELQRLLDDEDAADAKGPARGEKP